MRILHISQRYWPAVGGSEIHLGELSRRLVRAGHQVTVATTDALDFELFWDPRRRRVPEPEALVDGVRVLRFPVHHVPLPRLGYPALRRLLWLLTRTPWPPTPYVARLARFTPWAPGLWEWLDTTTEVFDIVAGMTICFEPLLAAGQSFARRRRVPYAIYPLTHLGAGPAPGDDPVSTFYTMRHQLDLVRASNAVFAQTNTERQYFIGQGVAAERIHVAGPGVEPAAVAGGSGERFRQRFSLSGPLVGAIGSMSFDKGTVHLVEAVQRLRAAGQPVQLVLAGALLTPFAAYLDSLPPAARAGIHVLGAIDEQTKHDLLDAIDVFALPSRTDSFGIVYLEAWLYGKPVIGARVWGIDDVIAHGQDGLLAPFGDVTALADALRLLLDFPALRGQLGANGRRKVLALHTWEHKFAVTERVYASLVPADKAAPCAS